MRVLAIDTSCDDTSVAVVQGGTRILANLVSSQMSVHQKYGGIVPELASRKHIETIVPLVSQALENGGTTLESLDGIVVTQGPGLIGSLLVGLSFAKSLAFARDLPFVGVNHIEGHLSAIFLDENPPRFPFVGLIVSGGHTSLYRVNGLGEYKNLGQTRDDAAGEAFDKVSKLLGLGYPGGPILDELSATGNPEAIRFPRPSLRKNSFDFSFSGLKTAVVHYVRAHPPPPAGYSNALLCDLAASFQEAVVEVLVTKTFQASESQGVKRVVVSGGVGANRQLRRRMEEEGRRRKVKVHIPPPALCTDNAAMIGVVGTYYLRKGIRSPYSLNAFSSLPLDEKP